MESWQIVAIIIGAAIVVLLGIIALIARFYRKPSQGTVLVRTGGSLRVSTTGMMVVPVFHKLEVMDIALKNVEQCLILREFLQKTRKVLFLTSPGSLVKGR